VYKGRLVGLTPREIALVKHAYEAGWATRVLPADWHLELSAVLGKG
jgi:hypothetical protein